MRFTMLSIVFSYILCGKLTDYFIESFGMNSSEFYKFLAYALGAGLTQFVYNIGYLKYRDRKNNESFYANQKINAAIIEKIEKQTEQQQDRLAKLEGKSSIYDMVFVKEENKTQIQ